MFAVVLCSSHGFTSQFFGLPLAFLRAFTHIRHCNGPLAHGATANPPCILLIPFITPAAPLLLGTTHVSLFDFIFSARRYRPHRYLSPTPQVQRVYSLPQRSVGRTAVEYWTLRTCSLPPKVVLSYPPRHTSFRSPHSSPPVLSTPVSLAHTAGHPRPPLRPAPTHLPRAPAMVLRWKMDGVNPSAAAVLSVAHFQASMPVHYLPHADHCPPPPSLFPRKRLFIVLS